MKLKKNLRTAATLARDAAEHVAAGAMDTLNSSPVQATSEAIATGARAVRTAGSQVAGQGATLARDTAGHAASLATDAVNSKVVQATTGAIATSAQTTTDAIATGIRTVRTAGSQVPTLARDTAGHAADLATDAVNSKAVQATTGAITTGAAAVGSAGSQAADYMCELPGWTRDAIAKAANSPAAAAGFTAAATTASYIDGFTKSLDWSSIDPTKYLYAGTRGASRGMTEALRVWEQIPEQIRMRGPESTAEYLDGKDWSHIRAHSVGGSNLASNGIWEDADINRARGAEQMTGTEIAAAADVANSAAFRAALTSAAESALTGGFAGAAVAGLLAILEEFLRFQRREIDESTMWNAIGRRIARAAATGAVVAGLLTMAVMAFPALAPIAAWLLIPVSVLGLAMYASRLAAAAAGLYKVATNGERLRAIGTIEKRLMLEAAGS